MTPDDDHHHHGHGREHGPDGQEPPSDIALRVSALESLLVEKGLVDPAALDAIVETYEHKVGPRNGARVVARAWADPAFKARLLRDAAAALSARWESLPTDTKSLKARPMGPPPRSDRHDEPRAFN